MKRVGFIVILFLCVMARAEPLPYFEMKQVVPEDMNDTNYVGVSVIDILLTNDNVYVQATNLSIELQGTYFLGLKTTTSIHWHDHYHPNPCVMELVLEHSSSTNKTDKWMMLEEDIDDPSRYLPEIWTLAVIDKNDAKNKEKEIQDRDKSKKWKPMKEHIK